MSIVGDWTAVGTGRYELGEGARWIGENFLFVDLLAGKLLSTDADASDVPRELFDLDVPLGAVAPRASGGFIAAAGTGVVVLQEHGIEWLAQPFADAPVRTRMNDATADPFGRLWAGAMPYDGTPGAGQLICVDTDGELHVALSGLTIPNGPAFSPDGRTMYLADSARGLILRYRLAPDGALNPEPDVFVTVDDASPDGMTVDADGHVWSALWGGHRLHRYSPDGRLMDVIEVPAEQPTSIALSTEEPGRILVTTAAHGLAAPGPLDGAVLTASTTATGIPTAVFG